jgi:hypothetical protein
MLRQNIAAAFGILKRRTLKCKRISRVYQQLLIGNIRTYGYARQLKKGGGGLIINPSAPLHMDFTGCLFL